VGSLWLELYGSGIMVEKTGVIGEMIWKSLFTSSGDLFTMGAEPLALRPNSHRCS
jgi:hypothetical protein